MRRNRKPGPRLVLRFILLTLLILAGYLSWRLLTDAAFFKVTQVEVKGDPGNLVTGEIVAATRDRNIILFPEEEIRRKLAAQIILERVEFTKVFPGKVVVTAYFREPLFSWQSSNGRFLVDSHGVAYREAGTESIPQVSSDSSSLRLGETLPAYQTDLVRRLLGATEGKFTLLVIKITGQHISVILSSNIEVLLTSGGSLDQEISALQLITTQAKIEGKIPRLIDLRYSKPLVTY
ncbi:MAG TPA: hypothetical protein VFK94_05885 [Patescibacteria group bacterium]|nr:hypothetical protein [Patescibacteria group bacterium]